MVKQHLVQIGRIDGPTGYLSWILAAIRCPGASLGVFLNAFYSSSVLLSSLELRNAQVYQPLNTSPPRNCVTSAVYLFLPHGGVRGFHWVELSTVT